MITTTQKCLKELITSYKIALFGSNHLAMKERKIKINSTIIYNIMLIISKNFKWHDDQTLSWDIKDITLKLQQELSNNLSNHNS